MTIFVAILSYTKMANFNKMAKMAIMACHDIAINIVKIIVYLKNKNKLGLCCAKLSLSWLQAYSASD